MSYQEEVVASKADLENGEMMQASVGDTDVLLVRRNDEFTAFHAYCTHYGAPLADGVLSNDRIVCPWHHACFNASTGDQCEPPGLDSLEVYDTRVEGDDILVRVPSAPAGSRTLEMSRRRPEDDRTFVILGGGAAGEYALESLRTEGFTGRLIMVTREAETPYDRPNCSKEFLQGEAPEEWMFLRGEGFYDDLDVERMHGRTVTELDAAAKTLTFKDGETLAFDGLILCTGGQPRHLDVDGASLKGIYTLRSYRDSKIIRTRGEESSHAVVVGASFIGLETACSLKELGVANVTVVAPEEIPFSRVLGDRVGAMVRALHEENGIEFRLGTTVNYFAGDTWVEEVVLEDGERLAADLVVIGVGVRPATDFVRGLDMSDDGSILVDDHLRAGDGVYAAGDIARFPDWHSGMNVRIEHWRLACQHGRLAGANLAGRDQPYRSIPYFWTAFFGMNIRYVGHAKEWDDIVYDGRPEDRSFIAFYTRDDRVIAASGTGRDTEMAAVEELMRREIMPPVDQLRQGGVDYVARLKG